MGIAGPKHQAQMPPSPSMDFFDDDDTWTWTLILLLQVKPLIRKALWRRERQAYPTRSNIVKAESELARLLFAHEPEILGDKAAGYGAALNERIQNLRHRYFRLRDEELWRGVPSGRLHEMVWDEISESILNKCPFFRELALLNGDIEEHNLENKAGPYHSQGNDLELNGQNAMACPRGILNPDPNPPPQDGNEVDNRYMLELNKYLEAENEYERILADQIVNTQNLELQREQMYLNYKLDKREMKLKVKEAGRKRRHELLLIEGKIRLAKSKKALLKKARRRKIKREMKE